MMQTVFTQSIYYIDGGMVNRAIVSSVQKAQKLIRLTSLAARVSSSQSITFFYLSYL